MLALSVVALLCTAAPEKPALVVLGLQPAGGVEQQVADAMTEAVTAQVAKAGYFNVLSSRDVQTLLGQERQKQLLGCTEESASCLSELAGAIGARFVMSGSLARLGDAYQLTLQTLDSQKTQPVGRSVRIAKSLPSLQAQLAYSVAEATATPAPPPPSHALPYALIGGGAVVMVGSAISGLDGLSRERALKQELTIGDTTPSVLRPLSAYQQDESSIRTEKTVALVGLAAGAALIGLGIYLNPADAPGGTAVALVPSGSGVALVGAFP